MINGLAQRIEEIAERLKSHKLSVAGAAGFVRFSISLGPTMIQRELCLPDPRVREYGAHLQSQAGEDRTTDGSRGSATASPRRSPGSVPNFGSASQGPMPTLDEQKQALRVRARKMRLVADQKEGPVAAAAAASTLLARLDEIGASSRRRWLPATGRSQPRSTTVRCWRGWHERGYVCALPLVAAASARSSSAAGRRWTRWNPASTKPGSRWHRRAGGGARRVIVPLLAFDAPGGAWAKGSATTTGRWRRCGRRRRVIAIGMAYAAQRFDRRAARAAGSADGLAADRGVAGPRAAA